MNRVAKRRMIARHHQCASAACIVLSGLGCEQSAAERASDGTNHAPQTQAIAAMAGSGGGPAIVLDGRFDDWAGIDASVVDPVDAPDAEIDLGSVTVTSDDRYVYMSLELRREINLQRLDGSLYVVFDADGDETTGETMHGLAGADIAIVFSPPHRTRPEAQHMGVRLVSTTHAEDARDDSTWLNVYDTGFFFAPTYASEVVECRVTRGVGIENTPTLFAGDSMRVAVVAVDAGGGVTDVVEAVTHEFPAPIANDAPGIERREDPLAPAADSLRVLSWNVKRGAMMNDPGPFQRIIKAVNPDVVLFQEIPDEVTVDQLAEVLEGRSPDAPWHVVIGAGGGDLRAAIASRVALSTSESLALVPFPENPDRAVRTVGAIIEHDGARMLLASVHLKCCGRIGSSEDDTRLREVALLGEAIRRAVAREDIDAAIVGGDFNLVGGYEPMAQLTVPFGGALGELTLLDPLRLDGSSNVTWAEPREVFVPGRLDFVLSSSDSTIVTNSFVFDSADLTPTWLGRHGLERGDAASVSDHRPVVVDIRPVDPTASNSENE